MNKSLNIIRVLFLLYVTFGLYGIISFIKVLDELTLEGMFKLLIISVLSVLYLYFAIRLKELLPRKKKIIQSVIIFAAVYYFIMWATMIVPLFDFKESILLNVFLFILISLPLLINLAALKYMYLGIGKYQIFSQASVQESDMQN